MLSFIGSSGSNCSWSRTEGKTAAGDFRVGGGSQLGEVHDFDFRRERAPSERSAAPPSEGSVRSSRSHSYSLKQGSARGAPGSPSGRHLGNIPPELTGSRRSCNTANGEFFVDIMWLFRAEVPKLFCLMDYKNCGLLVQPIRIRISAELKRSAACEPPNITWVLEISILKT